MQDYGNKTQFVLSRLSSLYGKFKGGISAGLLFGAPSVGNLGMALEGVFTSLGGVGTMAKGAGRLLVSAFSGNPVTAIKGLMNLLTGTKDVLSGIIDTAKNLVVAFVKMGMSAIPYISATAKEAEKLGMTYSDMATAVYKSKVPVEELGPALTKLQKALGNPSPELAGALHKVGLSTKELANASWEKKFGMIGDALDKVGNNATKIALETEIAGKAGANLFKLWAGGSEGFKKAREEAAALGLTMTQAEKARVQAAKGAMSNLKRAWQGLSNTAALTIAPMIEWFSKWLTEGIKWFNKFRPQLAEWGLYVKHVFTNISDYWKLNLKEMELSLAKWMQSTGAYWKSYYRAVKEWASGNFDKNSQEFKDIKDEYWQNKNITKENNPEGWQLQKEVWALRVKLSKAWTAMKKKSEEGIDPQTGEALNLSSAKPKSSGGSAPTYGSEEAFKIIAEAQGDKMFTVANKQLAELIEIRKAAIKAANKRATIVEAGIM